MCESNSLSRKTRGRRVQGAVLPPWHSTPLRSTKHTTFCPVRACRRAHSTAHHARFYYYLWTVLFASTPTHQSKPIAHAPCSGLVQYIFSSPARLRSRFPSAHAWCRHAADLKMLCILWRRALCGTRDTALAMDARERSPTPHNSYQRVRRNCISATSSFQCFGGTAPRTSQVASAFAFISRSTSA